MVWCGIYCLVKLSQIFWRLNFIRSGHRNCLIIKLAYIYGLDPLEFPLNLLESPPILRQRLRRIHCFICLWSPYIVIPDPFRNLLVLLQVPNNNALPSNSSRWLYKSFVSIGNRNSLVIYIAQLSVLSSKELACLILL